MKTFLHIVLVTLLSSINAFPADGPIVCCGSERLAPCTAGWLRHDAGMDRTAAISEIRASCNAIAGGVTRIHPLLPDLGDEATKGEIIKALFELTKAVETVKKQVMRLEKRDETALL